MDHLIKRRKRIRLKHFDYRQSPFIYHLTICTANKKSHFSDEEIAKVVIDELNHRKNIKEIYLYCYCLMPNHLHLLISLTDNYEKSLQNWVTSFKRYTTRIVKNSSGINTLWHINFYDHIIRKEESLLSVAEYILNNPVRKQLATDWVDYPYSRLVDDLPL